MGGGLSKTKKPKPAGTTASGKRKPVKRNSSIADMVGLGTDPTNMRVGELVQKGGQAVQWKPIPDNFSTVDEVTQALRQQGLRGSNLIIGIDFTKSNEWTGKTSFNACNLHKLDGAKQNPYQHAVSAIANTLKTFDDDNLIPVYGFGDALTNDRALFSFNVDDKPCEGLAQVLARYQQIVPHVKLAGPTSFAPLIYRAIHTVKESGGGYHILLIVADGQVTRSQDLPTNMFSRQEQETMQAIVEASDYPLSIVLVGVGDGPWDMMQHFDDSLPARKFDNFQFVNFSSMENTYKEPEKLNAVFAVSALMEVPEQYQLISNAGMINNPSRYENKRIKWKTRLIDPPDATPKQRAASTSGINELFKCPITKEVMKDPVIAADGYTYDRHAIEEWLSHHKTSPSTRHELENLKLTPNFALKSAISEALGIKDDLGSGSFSIRE